jgi:hypothetical protein
MAGKTGPAVARVDEQNRVRDQRRPPVACAYQNDENSRAKLQNVRRDSSAIDGAIRLLDQPQPVHRFGDMLETGEVGSRKSLNE